MRAVGYRQNGPISRPDALIDLELEPPQPGPNDLLVDVAAVAVNPVDTKIRKRRAPEPGGVEVLGWDAVGTVAECGSAVYGFAVGDRVYYAGAVNRPGCDSEQHLVDFRIAAHAPASLDVARTAALPLTSVTAWELLFTRLGVPRGGGAGQSILVLGAGGGVGSVLVQLARQLTELTVVGTASRPETTSWVRELGAHHVIDHRRPWGEQLRECGLDSVAMVACLTHTQQHWTEILEVVAPQGRIAVIDDPQEPLDTNAMKSKSLSLHWEFMYTRSLYQTPDMAEQGQILAEVAKLIDAGVIRTTVWQVVSPINASNLMAAHAILESGAAIGKIVLTDWA